eukprot:GHVS01028033.1.p1 GENE.GHVS01028033.1~~GHVS01028033.1.p1  ORF type:complete len:154 (-),score=7.66 GHVS01028033.1:39-500(-)
MNMAITLIWHASNCLLPHCAGCLLIDAASHQDVVDGNKDELHKVSDEAHQYKPKCTRVSDLLELPVVWLGTSPNQTNAVQRELPKTVQRISNRVVLIRKKSGSLHLHHCVLCMTVDKGGEIEGERPVQKRKKRVWAVNFGLRCLSFLLTFCVF